MQRWGTTRAGRQRFRCAQCGRSGSRRRTDNTIRQYRHAFITWLTGSVHLHDVAHQWSVSTVTAWQRLQSYWHELPVPQLSHPGVATVVLDATSVIKRQCMVLIALDPTTRQPLTWEFAIRESYASWKLLLVHLNQAGCTPAFVVCDGQRGLLKAIREVWPAAKIQRCLIHVVRQAKAWLTQRPKTIAGAELLTLVRALPDTRTRRQKRRWVRAYRCWCHRHDAFLKERSYAPTGKRWWYTHRKLRGVRSLLTNSVPELFTFIRYYQVPRTSNHVEGGINSRLKDLYRIHRGLSPWKKIVLTAWYLFERQQRKITKKPTRKLN